MIGIYKITSPSNKVYIGQSVNIKKRFNQYKRKECSKQPHIFNSLLKYGFENHTFEVIEECTIELLNERERYWQEFYNVLEIGLNCKLTQTNDKSGCFSIETKNKISIANKGKKASEETKKKFRELRIGKGNSMYGKTHSKETMKKILSSRRSYKGSGNVMFGKTHSKEAKLKISESAKINKNRSKIVLDLNTGVYYNSLIEYVNYSIYSRSYIINRINNKEIKNFNIIYA